MKRINYKRFSMVKHIQELLNKDTKICWAYEHIYDRSNEIDPAHQYQYDLYPTIGNIQQ